MAQFTESDLLPISALQHLIYCERQCALIHNEQFWDENRLTVEGQQLHEKAHDAKHSESRPGVRITRSLSLRSFAHGLIGKADIVEFPTAPSTSNPQDEHPKPRDERSESADPPTDHPHPLPIEYKRGRPKAHDADKVQLCAQALCLEEMLGLDDPIPAGRLFYGKTRRRQDVAFDQTLRTKTTDAITRLHELIASGQTPPARYAKAKCDRCSLINLCMPRQLQPRRTAARAFEQTLSAALNES